MNFVALEGLSSGLRAAAAAGALGVVGLLIVMYFLKLKRMRRDVPSTFLWKKSIEDMRANSPFQRLRRNLLLFLQLLILIAALVGLGRPALTASARTGATYLVLLDNSASMSATDVSPNRLAEGVRQVGRLVSDMHSGDAMMIMTFSSHPRVAAALTDDRSLLRAALSDIRPTDGRTDVNEPLQLAEAIAKTASSPQVVVVSDGGFLQPPQLETFEYPIQFIRVGSERMNIGITAMSVRRNVDDPTVGEIFANITNYTGSDAKTIVSLNIDGKLADATTAAIPAGGAHASVFKVKMDADRVAEVFLDYSDDLACDNKAWALIEKPTDTDVTIIGPADEFLRRALTAGSRFKVSEATGDQVPSGTGDNLPVYVYEGTGPKSLGRAGYLIFNAVPAAEGFKEDGVVDSPVVIDVDTSNPITALLDLGDIFIGKAKKLSFPPTTKILVNSDEIPLVALSYSGGARVITVAFDPVDSRWPLRISWPMFVSNAVNFLSGGGEALSSRQFAAGDVLVVPSEPGVEKMTVTDPEGRSSELPVTQQTVTYGDTWRAGIYSVSIGQRQVKYAANLINASESDIAPKSELVVGKTKVVAAVSAKQKNREIWRELLLFAFVVLLVEWYIYNRRVYV